MNMMAMPPALELHDLGYAALFEILNEPEVPFTVPAGSPK